jgi:hypothetical protein
MPQEVADLFPHAFQLDAEVHEHLGRHAFLFPEKAMQEVFRTHIIVIEVAGAFSYVQPTSRGDNECQLLPIQVTP